MSNNVGKELRDARESQFEQDPPTRKIKGYPTFDPSAPAPVKYESHGAFSEIESESRKRSASSGFNEDSMTLSPFKNDHFNSKLLGFDLGPVMNSQYDDKGYQDVFNPLVDFDKLKSDNQSAVTKIGAGVTQFAGKTAVGVVGNLLGGIYGLGKYVFTEDGTVNDIIDNQLYRNLDEANEAIAAKNTVFVNAKDGLGLNAKTLMEINDAFSFIAAMAISETIAQTVGNTVGMGIGAATTGLRLVRYKNMLGKTFRMLDKTEDIEKLAMDLGKTVDEMAAMRRNIEMVKKVGTASTNFARRALTTTGYEASLEGRGVKDDLLREGEAEIDYTISNSNMSEEEAVAFKAEKMKELESAANSAAMLTFGLNTAVLSASNAMQFPQIFGNSWVKHSGLGSVIRKGIGQAGTAEGKKAAVKKAMGTIGRVMKNPATEFMEETMQGVFSNYSKNWYELNLGLRSDSGAISPYVNNAADSMYDAITETYGTKDGLHEGVIGAIVGAIGLPGLKKTAKGRKIVMHGGIFGQDGGLAQNRAYNKNIETAINTVNARPMSDTLKYNKDNAIMATLDTQSEDAAVLAGNKVAFESTRDNKVFRYTVDRLDKGMENFIDEDINEIKTMASNDIEGYRKTFNKEDSFTQEEAIKEADNFEKKVGIYKKAYKTVHKDFNERMMRTDDVTQKLTDTLVYAVATEKIYTERLDKVKQDLFTILNGDFTKEEIDEFVSTSGLLAPFQKEIDDHIDAQNGKRKQKALDKQARMRAQMEPGNEKLFDLTKEQLQSKLAKTEDPGLKRQIEKAIELKEDYDAAGKFNPFQADKSSIVNKKRKANEEARSKIDIDALNKEISDRVSEEMKTISKPPRKLTIKELDAYMIQKEKIREKLNAHYNSRSVYDRSDDDHETALDFNQEMYEITDRLMTATNVAGYLYGFKNNPYEAYLKIVKAQMTADLGNARKMVTNLDQLMLHVEVGNPEFASLFTEFKDVLAALEKDFDTAKISLNPEDIAKIAQTIKELRRNVKKYNEFLGLKEDLAKQSEEAKDNINPEDKEETTPGEGNGAPVKPVDPDKKKGSKESQEAVARDEQTNKFVIREGGKFGEEVPQFEQLLNEGKLRKDTAVTLDGVEDSQYDPENNPYLKDKLIKAGGITEDNSDDPDYVDVETARKNIQAQIDDAITLLVEPTADKPFWSVKDPITGEIETSEHGTEYSREDIIALMLAEIKPALDALDAVDAKQKSKPVGKLSTNNSVLDSYVAGYKKIQEKPTLLNKKEIRDLDPDVYTFIRFAPAKISYYDKPLSAENKYAYDIAEDDTKVFEQWMFISKDVIALSNESRANYAEYQEKKEALEAKRDLDIEKNKTYKKDDPAKDYEYRIRHKYDQELEDLKNNYLSEPYSDFSNFNFRHQLFKNKFNTDSAQIKLKIANVDLGNFQVFNHERDIVRDLSPATIGYQAKNMTVDDIYYSTQGGEFVRIDRKKLTELPNHPFAGMNSKANGKIFFKYKDIAGREVPIKMNTKKLSHDDIKDIIEVLTDFYDSPSKSEFTVSNSKVPFLKGKTIEEYLSFYLKTHMDKKSRDILFLKNTFAYFDSKEGVHEFEFSVGGKAGIKVKGVDDLAQLYDHLKDQRQNVNADYLTIEEEGKPTTLNTDVLQYYFDKGIITHPFEKEKNFDQIYSKTKINKQGKEVPYQKGVVLSFNDTVAAVSPKKPQNYDTAIKELRESLGKPKWSKKSYQVNLKSLNTKFLNDISYSVKMRSNAFEKANPGKKPSTAEKAKMIREAVDTVMDKKINQVMMVANDHPNHFNFEGNHENDPVFRKSDKDGQVKDSELDMFMRVLYEAKNNVYSNETFIKRIAADSETFGAKTTLKNKFKKPGAGVTQSIQSYSDKGANKVKTHFTTKEEFDNFMKVIYVLQDLTAMERSIDINYTDESTLYPRKKYEPTKDKTKKAHYRTKLSSVKIEDPLRFAIDENGVPQITSGRVLFNVRDLKNGKQEGSQLVVIAPTTGPLQSMQNIITSVNFPFLGQDFSELKNEKGESLLQKAVDLVKQRKDNWDEYAPKAEKDMLDAHKADLAETVTDNEMDPDKQDQHLKDMLAKGGLQGDADTAEPDVDPDVNNDGFETGDDFIKDTNKVNVLLALTDMNAHTYDMLPDMMNDMSIGNLVENYKNLGITDAETLISIRSKIKDNNLSSDQLINFAYRVFPVSNNIKVDDNGVPLDRKDCNG